MLSALLTVLVVPTQVKDQAYFAILAETVVGRMAGEEPFDLDDLPPGIALPKEVMMFAGVPTRFLNMRLWSPTIAPAGATASVAPPAGLKQGQKLDLDLYRPEPTQTTAGAVKGFEPDKGGEFTIKIYWGSSDKVREGQPRIIKWSDLGDDERAGMRERAREAQSSSSYFYKPGWTTAFWPTPKQPGKIAKDASLVGNYSLTSSYTGNVEIGAPSNVTFLDAFDVKTPNLDKKLDLKKALPFTWNPIPNALGIYATIFGMEGQNTMVLWSSSEVFTNQFMADMGFLQMAEVRDFVGKTVFMAGDSAKVTVPIGIFQKCPFAMMEMVGYGPGAALETAQPLPRIQTKTTFKLMIGEM